MPAQPWQRRGASPAAGDGRAGVPCRRRLHLPTMSEPHTDNNGASQKADEATKATPQHPTAATRPCRCLAAAGQHQTTTPPGSTKTRKQRLAVD
ncbi:hypothetical protein E2C01_024430 [Portunus trituberculatus]|uniref:Uncharacterized protein n=1 Tax=Portunus trituberculatus TaxID=210409 RepID=A0A5B7EAC0_PORTR|nr:hypothetical protein [Portunus trituberculatus]